MPPLCTAGFGIATGQWAYFLGAFYLYLINSVFISISTFLIVRFLKFRAVEHVDIATSKKIKKWIGSIALLTIIPSLFWRTLLLIMKYLTKELCNLLMKKLFP
jgi:uncharacterized membrane protein